MSGVRRAAWIAVMGVAGCGIGDDTAVRAGGRVVVDDAGDTLVVSAPHTRVVSLIPAVTDLLAAMGARDRLVGRTRFDLAAELAHLPSVGGGIDPDLETLATLGPDLVVVWRDPERRSAAGQVAALGLTAYAAEYQTLADVRRHAEQLGLLLDLEVEAAEVVREMDDRIEAVRSAVAGRARPSVVYVASRTPPMVAGGGTFVDSVMHRSGGQNVFADLSGWPQVSFETLVDRGADVLLLPSAGPDGTGARLEDAPGWREVLGGRDIRVVEVDPDLFGRPGPGLATAVERLGRHLHPGAFEAPSG